VLRERVFLGGQAVSMLGDGLAILAIPLLVMQLTRSPFASWRLGGQTVTLVGGVLAGALAGPLGGNPRPVIAAGCLTLFTVTVAWLAALQKENASGVAVRLLGK
jgi:hypothetical protein